MALDVNGKTVELDGNGNLVDPTQWDEDVAKALAAADDTMGELTQEHFDVLKYLREEYFNNNSNQPMERQINKDMGKIWGKKISSKDLYQLFPGAPSKQGNRIAGLPYIARKGGY
ncbi:MAG: TusE/DsrC/DsvC family sulfur relay protein [Gammaproteobacteria bacterium]|nr:TusE/DsrC/DsvC family sulfur relay protein [Gammaproteobacteria bacterium]